MERGMQQLHGFRGCAFEVSTSYSAAPTFLQPALIRRAKGIAGFIAALELTVIGSA